MHVEHSLWECLSWAVAILAIECGKSPGVSLWRLLRMRPGELYAQMRRSPPAHPYTGAALAMLSAVCFWIARHCNLTNDVS